MGTSIPEDQDTAKTKDQAKDQAEDQAEDQSEDQAADPATDDEASAGAPAAVDHAALLQELATGVALLPQEPPANGVATPEGAIALPVVEQDGTQYVPVFTSEEAMRAAGADLATARRLPIAQLAGSLSGKNLWLAVNPANEDGLALPPEFVRALADYVQTPGDDAGS